MSSRSTIQWQYLIVVFVCYSCVQSSQRRAVAPDQKSPYLTDGGVSKAPVKKCPLGQLDHLDSHNNTVCCFPTACQPDFYIEECTSNGGEDVCKPCANNTRQPHYVSSAYMRDSKCFEYNPERHNNCAKGDHVIHDTMYKESCAYFCKCDTSKCFYGDPCHCMDIAKCDVNEEMDPETNTCKPCPWYAFKHTKGCERCQINITLWRLGDPDRRGKPDYMPPLTTTSPPDSPAPPVPPDKIINNNTSNKEMFSPTEAVIKNGEDNKPSLNDYLFPILLAISILFEMRRKKSNLTLSSYNRKQRKVKLLNDQAHDQPHWSKCSECSSSVHLFPASQELCTQGTIQEFSKENWMSPLRNHQSSNVQSKKMYVLTDKLILLRISIILILAFMLVLLRNNTHVRLMRGKISGWFGISHESGTPTADSANVVLLPPDDRPSGDRSPDNPETRYHNTGPDTAADGGRELNSVESRAGSIREASGRDEILYKRVRQDEEIPQAVRMEQLKSLQNAAVNPLMRQTSYVVEAEINTPSDSSAGTPSDTEDIETNIVGGTSQKSKEKQGSSKAVSVQCPSLVTGVNTPVPAGNQQAESGIGMSLPLSGLVPSQDIEQGLVPSQHCRGEHAVVENVEREPVSNSTLSTSLGSSEPPSIGQRQVTGASGSYTGPPLVIPPVIRSSRADNGSTPSPISPKIQLPDGGGTTRGGRPCAAITPLPRVHDNDLRYTSGGNDSSMGLQNSNQTESIPSYAFLHQDLDNGNLDVGRISDFSMDTSGQPMYSNSQNNSISSLGRRSQNPPEGAEYDGNFMSMDDRENTEPKEVAPDVFGHDETLCKYVDRDNTSPKVVCEESGNDSVDTEYGKITDMGKCLGVDTKDIVDMREDSSSVISGLGEVTHRHDTGDLSVVMEDNVEDQDADIDKLLHDDSWSKQDTDETNETSVQSEPVNTSSGESADTEITTQTDSTQGNKADKEGNDSKESKSAK